VRGALIHDRSLAQFGASGIHPGLNAGRSKNRIF
jgi:hypothetical protein